MQGVSGNIVSAYEESPCGNIGDLVRKAVENTMIALLDEETDQPVRAVCLVKLICANGDGTGFPYPEP